MEKTQYLLTIQYLGFRLHGFQKQTNAKTVQELLDKTISYILGDQKFKTFSSSRTDTMVSANKMLVLLQTRGKIDTEYVFEELNKNLPQDIKALELKPHPEKIDIIGDVKEKTYHYYFTYGEKLNPMSAPFMHSFQFELDIDLMKNGCNEFLGRNNFAHYCFRGNEEKNYERELSEVFIYENDIITANFFPKKSFYLKVRGKGFMRHQIRLIMGALINLGKGEISIEDLQNSLKEGYQGKKVNFIAPAAPLVLYDISF